jgi:hypothetical protein
MVIKQIASVLILFFTLNNVKNLVLNSGFEETSRRQIVMSGFKDTTQEFYAKHWLSTLNTTPDLIDLTDTTDNSLSFYEKKLLRRKLSLDEKLDSVHGSCYAGIVLFGANPYSEFLTATFSSPLKTKTNYIIKLKIRFSKKKSYYCCKNIELIFSDQYFFDDYNTEQKKIILNDMKTKNTTANFNYFGAVKKKKNDIVISLERVNEVENWMELSANYLAIGGEKFMTIGKFYEDEQSEQNYFRKTGGQYGYNLPCYTKWKFLYPNENYEKEKSKHCFDRISYYYIDDIMLLEK